MAYYEIQYMIDNNLATRYWDEERKVPYIVTNTNDWIGYDDAESFEAKLDFLKSRGVRGAMVWAIDLDELFNNYPLLNVIRDSLEGYNPLGTDDDSTLVTSSPSDSTVDDDEEEVDSIDQLGANADSDEAGANSVLVAVLVSSLVLVMCGVCCCGLIFGGFFLYGQTTKIPEPSAPELADSQGTQYDVKFDCEDIKALKKQIARLEAAQKGTVEGSADIATGTKQEAP